MPDTLTIVSAIVIVVIVGFALRGAAREHPFEKGELWRSVAQCIIAISFAAPVWLYWDAPENRIGRVIACLVVGYAAAWGLTKLYARVRYGKDTKVDMD